MLAGISDEPLEDWKRSLFHLADDTNFEVEFFNQSC